MQYPTDSPISTFIDTDAVIPPVTFIPIMEEGRSALEKVNVTQGLGFDSFDIPFYTEMFKEKLKRNPSNVEAFDMGQSNSEHSRHWFFGGKQVIDGVEQVSNSHNKLPKGTDFHALLVKFEPGGRHQNTEAQRGPGQAYETF